MAGEATDLADDALPRQTNLHEGVVHDIAEGETGGHRNLLLERFLTMMEVQWLHLSGEENVRIRNWCALAFGPTCVDQGIENNNSSRIRIEFSKTV